MYLVMHYGTKEVLKDPPTLEVVNKLRVWRVIDEAKTKSLRIAVYELDSCLLDWS